MEDTRNLPVQARVLIVDDDAISRHQIKHLAGKFVTEIKVANDGLEGLETWKNWRPDVTVTDIIMPRMDGLAMCQAIKAEDIDAQIIVITGDKSDENLRHALRVGVERYIEKPIDVHLLGDALLKCVRDRQQIRELRLTRQIAILSQNLQQQLEEKKRTEEALQREKAEQQLLINRLEEAHNQLLQSEKMASIGQLAAGVAHEINNPIGYVNANLGSLQQYVNSLLKLIAAFEQHEIELPDATQAELARQKTAMDLEYLRGDIGDLFTESLSGLQRVKRIIQDLKDFSHVSDSGMQWTNLENGMESTLNVVWNELKYKAEIIKDYGGIPTVECIASQINQVFMNLLVNAAQAITDRGTITIRTRVVDDFACIEVSDTGKGIPPEILNRIFDPFFTTKPIGMGTGLGLSISHGIIRKHNGRIEVDSEPGKGTTFRILIPLKSATGDEESSS